MKLLERSLTLFFIILVLSGLFIQGKPGTKDKSQERQKLLFDDDWRFQQGDQTSTEEISFDDSKWRILNIPHDWSIEGIYDKDAPTGGSGGYLPTGIGWYRKHFQINKDDLSGVTWIEFDGVYMNSDVWINEHHLGNHPYGYTSFYYELTQYLKEGDNVIAVRVDNSLQPNTRWYTGSGIYRNVWLVKVNPLHISHWGVTVSTPTVSKDFVSVEVKTMIENRSTKPGKGLLRLVLINNYGQEVVNAEQTFLSSNDKTIELRENLSIKSPELWSIESPNLYKLHSRIIEGGKIVDEVTTNIGLREIKYDFDKGFFLNGNHVKMNGVCLHHDGGSVGAAVPEQIWKYRLEKLKEMGCNSIRTSHNPPAPEFLDLCDKMGFLVMDEPFDEWEIGKRKYGYHDYFDKWWENDLLSMIQRDYNHPSVVLWSAGNEIPEQKTVKGAELLQSLVEVFHKNDSTRPVTLACDNIAADGGETTIEFLNGLDIVGYNYVDRWHARRESYYDIDRHDHPNWKMIGSESISNSGGIRGDYSLGNDSKVVRPNYNYEMIDAEQLWKYVSTRNYVIGDFMWTGIDYLGEAFWPHKSASFGVLDLCGFQKDGYYFYQSRWTEKPMIHLFPHWNWNGREGQVIPVMCYTNCDAVELFLNGRSYGEKRIEFPRQGNSKGWNKYDKPRIYPTTGDLHLEWDVSYEPGILKAVGKKEGKIVFTEEIQTTGKPSVLRLKADRDTISSGSRDIAIIRIEVLDSEGRTVPTADNRIEFIIEGEGKIIGVDNGNPIDHDSYKINKRKAFNGLCQAIVRSTNNPGKIKLTVKSEGLKEASLELNSLRLRNIGD
jgi:beta-galactosidase